jgi:hypothetical protein
MLGAMMQNFIAYSEVPSENGNVRIAEFIASLNLETKEVTFAVRHLNKDLCKKHRDIVRADQASFEDFIYKTQDKLQ